MPDLDPDLPAVRARVHKLNDMVQGHEGEIREARVLIEVLKGQYEALRGSTATKEQLDATRAQLTAGLEAAKVHVDNAVGTVTIKLDHLHEELAPIKRGIYWAVGLIVSAVAIAVISLVVKGNP